MTSVVLHPHSDCAPRAIRTVAMAAAISLNLVALLIALQPLPPITVAAPIPQIALRAILLQPPLTLPQPPLPALKPVQHVTPPAPARIVPHPVTVVPVDTTPVTISAPVQTSTPKPVTTGAPTVSTGSSDATIAYETATPPAYPVAALRDGLEGTVLLRVLVDESGHPVQVLIDHSSGSRALDQAAREHVLAAWRFHPAQLDGHAVRAWAQVPVKFSLQDL